MHFKWATDKAVFYLKNSLLATLGTHEMCLIKGHEHEGQSLCKFVHFASKNLWTVQHFLKD